MTVGPGPLTSSATIPTGFAEPGPGERLYRHPALKSVIVVTREEGSFCKAKLKPFTSFLHIESSHFCLQNLSFCNFVF